MFTGATEGHKMRKILLRLFPWVAYLLPWRAIHVVLLDGLVMLLTKGKLNGCGFKCSRHNDMLM